MKILKFKYLKQFAFSFIAIFLCFTIIFSMTSVSVKAVSGIDDALFWLLVAVLGASGITFVSASDARLQCQDFFDGLSQDVKNTLTEKADLILGSSVVGRGVKVGVHFLAEQWRQLTTAIVNKYGNKGTLAVEGYQAGRKLDVNNLNDKFLAYSYYNVGQITTSKVNNLTMTTFSGSDFASVVNYLSAEQLVDINIRDDYVYRSIDLGSGLFTSYSVMSYSASSDQSWRGYFGWYQDLGYITDVSFQTGAMLSRHFKYFQGELLKVTDVVRDSIHYKTIYTDTLSNIVDLSTCTLVNTSISVPQTVVERDGVWTGEEWGRFLNDLIFGNDITGLINCDPAYYPGIDTWHDGICDDVATTDRPAGSIGIAVPTDNTDVVLSPPVARDYDNTDVKDIDIALPVDPEPSSEFPTSSSSTEPFELPPSINNMRPVERLFKTKFPFCLPYDVYKVVLNLQSEPIAPVLRVPVRVGVLDDEFSIDFSDFEDEIKIFKWFVAAGFVAALIYATKRFLS